MPRFDVKRSLVIEAPPKKVFDTVVDFGTWTTWSPWLAAEPEARVEVSGDSSSTGSTYSWDGAIVGAGEVEHRRLDAPHRIEDEIRFQRPFKSRSDVGFELQPAGNGTEISWYMRGSLPWFLFWMKPQMETYIAMDYDRGLKMLKELVETGEIMAQTNIRGVEPVGPLRILGVRKQCVMKDMSSSMEAAFCEAKTGFDDAGLKVTGDAASVYHKFDMKNQLVDYTSGFVVEQASGNTPAGLSDWSLPQSQALCVEHVGKYEHLGNSWSAAQQIARTKKMKLSKLGCYELYKNDPAETAPAELRTEIYLPLR